ncbi:MAG TPA: enoyl-CoA hydratase/isomerase family protein [Magnetospirillum sp.]|nr:enoyl-CoA hydratase/isomerase family protein [Magnetospirillum sp.]
METEFSRHGALARIRLNRPHVLNALGPAQFPALHRQLTEWLADDGVGAIVVEGAGGRAFSAGGDIRVVWDGRDKVAANRSLFRAEYALDRLIHRLAKPYVALLDGIVMGGGAGLSVNGPFQVVTERTVFAMPEAAIGFFPDVGATHFLSRCPGRVGLYLGLTGARLGAADMIWAGLATHYVSSARLDKLKGELVAAAASADPWSAVRETLGRAQEIPPAGVLQDRADAINAYFGGPDIYAVMADVQTARVPWAVEAHERMSKASPTSLAVIFQQLTEGRTLEFEQAIAREYRMACAFLAAQDFYEGIRAAVVDKDWRPHWQPATLDEVSPHSVARYFVAVPDELTFDDGGCGGHQA